MLIKAASWIFSSELAFIFFHIDNLSTNLTALTSLKFKILLYYSYIYLWSFFFPWLGFFFFIRFFYLLFSSLLFSLIHLDLCWHLNFQSFLFFYVYIEGWWEKKTQILWFLYLFIINYMLIFPRHCTYDIIYPSAFLFSHFWFLISKIIMYMYT